MTDESHSGTPPAGILIPRRHHGLQAFALKVSCATAPKQIDDSTQLTPPSRSGEPVTASINAALFPICLGEGLSRAWEHGIEINLICFILHFVVFHVTMDDAPSLSELTVHQRPCSEIETGLAIFDGMVDFPR